MSVYTQDDVKSRLRLYFICGSTNVNRPLPTILREAISGGITMFQFREKGTNSLTGDKKLALACELQVICQEHHIPFIINDDVALAVKLNADGIHVGQGDESAASVREKIGRDKILGVSANTLADAKQAIKDGATYIGTGPMYETSSKDDADDVCGPERIKEFRQRGLTIPIVAIGGITADNTPPILAAGANGVSIISAIAGASSPAEAAARFNKAIVNKF
ncbi:thiamine phosphate synthase [Bacillus sp. A116_S68]|nr:thiamine phosphate synthase [Bacillus sp. A116_S68]